MTCRRWRLLWLGAWLGVASGQWLEMRVELPDSLTGVARPRLWAVDGRERVYVAEEDGDCVIVIDGATGAKLGRIAVPAGVTALAAYPERDEVYASSEGNPGWLSVLDCITLELEAIIPGGNHVWDMLVNPATQRLYCADEDGGLLVYDCVTRRSLGSVPVEEPWDLELNTRHDVLYVLSENGSPLYVVDALADTVIAEIEDVDYALWQLYDPGRDRLYVLDSDYEEILVLDGATNSIVAAWPAGAFEDENYRQVFACDTACDRLYAVCYEGMQVFDAEQGTLVTLIPMQDGATAVAVDQMRHKAWCTPYEGDTLVVLDCQGDSVRKQLTGVEDAAGLAVCVGAGRVYVVNPNYNGVSMVDADLDSTMGRVVTGFPASRVVPAGQKLYCTGGTGYDGHLSGLVFSLDAETGTPSGFVDAGPVVQQACHIQLPTGPKLYCIQANGVTVVHEGPDTVLARIPLAWVYYPVAAADELHDKLYVAGQYGAPPGISVIDCRTDSVIRFIELAEGPRLLRFGEFPSLPGRGARVYAASYHCLTVVDCAADTVLATIAITDVHSDICPVAARNRLFCTDAAGVVVIDAATNSVIRRAITTSTIDLEPYPAGRTVFALQYGGYELYALDDSTGDVLGQTQLPFAPLALACDTTAGRLYVSEWNLSPYGDRVHVYDCMTLEPLRTLNLGSVATNPTWDADHRRIWVGLSEASTIAAIRDTFVAGIAEEVTNVECRMTIGQTVVRSVLNLQATSVLLDATGSRVLDLHPGDNDVSRLAPGIYFLRPASGAGGIASRVTKVIVTH